LTLTQLVSLGVFPAAIVVAAGLLLQRGKSPRCLLYLAGATALLLLLITIAGRLTPAQDSWPGFQVTFLLAPVTMGALTLVLLHWPEARALGRGEQVLALLLGLVSVALLGLSLSDRRFALTLLIGPGALALALVWTLGRDGRPLAAVGVLAAFAGLGWYNALIAGAWQLPESPGWLSLPALALSYSLPSLAVALAAVMVSSALQPPRPDQAGAASPWPAVWRLAVALSLLGYLGYTIAWVSVWDQTSDGMSGLSLSLSAGLGAIAAGMVLALTASGWRRLAGLAFGVAVPLALFAAFDYGWDISYHALTEARAARLEAALERYHARTGSYPADLTALIPGELWWIPAPVILRGQGWCYQAGPETYRLGAVYREYFSTPLSVRVYASVNDPLGTTWDCDARLAELKPRYEPQPLTGASPALPTPAPLPTSVLAEPRTMVTPLLPAASVSVGAWSPDGRYLPLGRLETGGGQSVLSLFFLNAQTGALCPAGATQWLLDDLREQSAWLPDGRLLLVTEVGEMVLFRPCVEGREPITERYSVAFTQAVAYDAASGRVLLKNAAAYWILDGASLEAQPLAGVSPNPYDLHWDRAAWSPGGRQLAIARLNGQDRQAGATLYLVEGATGAVNRSLPLATDSDQSAPLVEWLTDDQLLIHGAGGLTVLDLSSATPRSVDVLRDIFLLEVVYPDEVTAMASIPEPAAGRYHLAVRVNHPRNQGVYVYHSETGQVEVLHSDADLLLFFPDGQWADLGTSAAVPAERDEYELVWVDGPGTEPHRLTADGHRPRNYPTLVPRYLPAAAQLAFGSSQGVSLVSVSDGDLLGFWELQGGQGGQSIRLITFPDSGGLLALVAGAGLYYLPLR